MSVYDSTTKQSKLILDIVRDILPHAQDGPYFVRERVRALLTPIETRMRIVDELRGRDQQFTQRSLRQRLTQLDRALSDGQAATLDRAYTAWLSFEGKGKSVDPTAVHGGGDTEQAPLGRKELRECGAFQEMRKRLAAVWRERMERLFIVMAPWRPPLKRKLTRSELMTAKELANQIKNAYRTK